MQQTFPRTAAGLRFWSKKPPSFCKTSAAFFFTLLHLKQERCNLPSYIACQKEADDSQNHDDSCFHCTPSRSKFRHLSTSVSFEEQPPVLSDLSYGCASLYFRQILRCILGSLCWRERRLPGHGVSKIATNICFSSIFVFRRKQFFQQIAVWAEFLKMTEQILDGFAVNTFNRFGKINLIFKAICKQDYVCKRS